MKKHALPNAKLETNQKDQRKKKKRRNIAQAPKKPPLHAAVHDRLHHHPATNDQP